MAEPITREVRVMSPNGLHARPSHGVVALSSEFDADIQLECQGRVANARSILSVMTLGAAHEDVLILSATGVQAEEALERLAIFFESAFEEGGA